jgi:flagellar biosynthetic protein FlhB
VGKREGKTEAPTDKKKRDARRKGTTSKSQDLGPWIVLLVSTYVIPSTVSALGDAATDSLAAVKQVASAPDPMVAVKQFGETMQAGLMGVLPLLMIVTLIGIVSHVGQTGLVLSMHPLKPDFKRINPLQGVKRLFSPRSVWETGKQMVKGSVIAGLCWPKVTEIADQLTAKGRVPLLEGVSASAKALVGMTRATCYAIIAIALADFAFQRRIKILDLRMTKQEVRDEYRNSEGDPHVKQRIRALQQAMSRSRMMDDIATASVVVTNPTHVAVALRYDAGAGGAPRVVAAGVGALAARIREKAMATGVPIVEAKPLARALYRACDVGDEIPVALYEAVARVLAFVRRLRGSILSASALPLPRQYAVDDQLLESITGRRRRRRLPA